MKLRHILAACLAVAAVACSGDLVGPPPATDHASLFDTVWREFDLHYSFFELKGIDWAAVGARHRAAALAATSDRAFAARARRDARRAARPARLTDAVRRGSTMRYIAPYDTVPIALQRALDDGALRAERLTTAGGSGHIRYGMAVAGRRVSPHRELPRRGLVGRGRRSARRASRRDVDDHRHSRQRRRESERRVRDRGPIRRPRPHDRLPALPQRRRPRRFHRTTSRRPSDRQGGRRLLRPGLRAHQSRRLQQRRGLRARDARAPADARSWATRPAARRADRSFASCRTDGRTSCRSGSSTRPTSRRSRAAGLAPDIVVKPTVTTFGRAAAIPSSIRHSGSPRPRANASAERQRSAIITPSWRSASPARCE